MDRRMKINFVSRRIMMTNTWTTFLLDSAHSKYFRNFLGMLLLISFCQLGESRPNPASELQYNSGPFFVSQSAYPSSLITVASLGPHTTIRGGSYDGSVDGDQPHFNLDGSSELSIFVPSLTVNEDEKVSENLAVTPPPPPTSPYAQLGQQTETIGTMSLIQRKRKNLYNSHQSGSNQLVNGGSLEDYEKNKSRNKNSAVEGQLNRENAQSVHKISAHLKDERTKQLDTVPAPTAGSSPPSSPVEIKFHAAPLLVSPPIVDDEKTFLHEKPGPLSLLDELGSTL